MEILITIIVLAFFFELMDSSAGMGFGTSMSPLLLLMGYDPLQVVPVLLVSETVTGFFAGAFHHEFENVRFSFRDMNRATKVMLLIAGVGCIAIFFSVIITIGLSRAAVKTYVAVLVLAMGVIGLFRFEKEREWSYRPKILVGFAALAGFNKGIGGGGYGPVVTMGEIFSGIYEKSAVGIVSLAEGIVSLVGVGSYFLISAVGETLDFMLLPSVFTGGFFAAILSPYMVRVLPNKAWRIIIPLYAFSIGIFLILKMYVL